MNNNAQCHWPWITDMFFPSHREPEGTAEERCLWNVVLPSWGEAVINWMLLLMTVTALLASTNIILWVLSVPTLSLELYNCLTFFSFYYCRPKYWSDAQFWSCSVNTSNNKYSNLWSTHFNFRLEITENPTHFRSSPMLSKCRYR